MSSRVDTYARKDSAESFGVAETACGGETADEWEKERDLGLAHIGAQEGSRHEEEEAALETEAE